MKTIYLIKIKNKSPHAEFDHYFAFNSNTIAEEASLIAGISDENYKLYLATLCNLEEFEIINRYL